MQKICNSETNIIQLQYIVEISLTFCYLLSVYRFIFNNKKSFSNFMFAAVTYVGRYQEVHL